MRLVNRSFVVLLVVLSVCLRCHGFFIVKNLHNRETKQYFQKHDQDSGVSRDIGKRKLAYKRIDQRPYRVGDKPASGFILAKNNFVKEFNQILQSLNVLKDENPGLPECLDLKLDDEAVQLAEERRERLKGPIEVNPVAKLFFQWSCIIIDNCFRGRPIPKFWVLETVARIPYFSFVSMLHLYETLGWWRQPSLRQVHSAEEYNELHHLLIMESLGGDKIWRDRFLGYHCAILYYWLIVATYLFSPKVAYQFMELLEAHANDTYGEFVIQNEDALRSIPPPDIAVSYYTGADLYQFDEFQVDKKPGSRRPPCESLYDVFSNIRDDEAEHISTMKACQNYATLGDLVISPHIKFEEDESEDYDSISNDNNSSSSNGSGKSQKRESWKEWSRKINERAKKSKQPI